MFDICEDSLDRGGPNERFRAGIGEFDVFINGGDQVSYAWESASANPFLRDLAEPPFDHV